MPSSKGQTVFVNGGSTAVGRFAIQLAKSKGAKVVATAPARNEELVRSIGTDEFIDYTNEPLVQYLTRNPPRTKYQLIFDAVGVVDTALFKQSAAYLASDGVFVTTGPLPKSPALSELWKMFKNLGAVSIPWWMGNVKRRWA
ncbi:hypothetical protein BDZ97DRAFT_432557 [Flammula alnicola]|nr:hypothetical protein BDZ97DRAFT_432557 [Flammula alnicola]